VVTPFAVEYVVVPSEVVREREEKFQLGVVQEPIGPSA
jgi:hypothetical protein